MALLKGFLEAGKSASKFMSMLLGGLPSLLLGLELGLEFRPLLVGRLPFLFQGFKRVVNLADLFLQLSFLGFYGGKLFGIVLPLLP